MTKHWKVADRSTEYSTLADATEAAKRYAKKYSADTATIYEAVAFVQTPTPEYTVTPLN